MNIFCSLSSPCTPMLSAVYTNPHLVRLVYGNSEVPWGSHHGAVAVQHANKAVYLCRNIDLLIHRLRHVRYVGEANLPTKKPIIATKNLSIISIFENSSSAAVTTLRKLHYLSSTTNSTNLQVQLIS